MKAGTFLNRDENKRCDTLKSAWPRKLRLVT
jgi:hypothetical protein